MRLATTVSVLLSTVSGINAVSIRQAQQNIAAVDLSNTTGPAQVIASGWIYGFPDNGVQADSSIPENFIRDVKFIASRAGGAQTPSRGWIDGYDGYLPRWHSTLSNYRTTRKYGGTFIVLVHDLWGADGSSISLYPGDNGDWTQTDAFLEQLADDIERDNILEDLVLDLWNEPDLDIFWDRPWNQYLAYYTRAHKYFKQRLSSTLISGPSMADSPNLTNDKWETWVSTIASNNTIPDIYSWHQIGEWSREPDTTVPDFDTLRQAQRLPERPIDVNEYASREEQNPGTSVYYIAQLERHNIRGLRANWGSTTALHDYLADLVFKRSDGSYRPNGEWQLYKYYANMQGDRIATTASADRLFDVFATRSGNSLKIIAGTRRVQSPYQIRISALSSLGLPAEGSVNVKTYRFDWAGPAGEVGAPVDLGTSRIAYTAGSVTIQVDPATSATAYAYEIS